MDITQLREAARLCVLLAPLTDEELDHVVETAETTSYIDGQCIFRAGDEDTDLCIITAGRVRISQEASGDESKTLALLSPPASFGEMGMAAGLARTADAFADGQTTLLRIKQAALFDLIDRESPSAAKVMLEMFRTVGPRMRQTNIELGALYAAGRLINENVELGALLHEMVGILMQATNSMHGAVLLYNVSTDTLDGAAAQGYEDEDFTQWSEASGTGGASQALEHWHTLVVEDWNTDERTKGLPVTGYERVALMIAPLLAGDEAIGVFVLGDRKSAAGEFEPYRAADQVLLEGLAAMTAAGIANARHRAEEHEQDKLRRHYIGES